MPQQLLDIPEEPKELSYVWDWYAECFTGDVLKWSDIYYWAEITETPIKGWEAKLIKAIDQDFWSTRGSS